MTQTFKDPVCGMTVNPQSAAFTVYYKGQVYYFCSQMCKTLFEREPEKYLIKEEEQEKTS